MDTPQSSTPLRPALADADYQYPDYPPNKRYRSDSDNVKRESADPTGVSNTSFASSYVSSPYTMGRSATSASYTTLGGQYSTFGNLTTGSTAPYPFRPTLQNFPNNYPTGISNISNNYDYSSMSGAGLSSHTNTAAHRYGDLQPPYTSIQGYDQPRPASSNIPLNDETREFALDRPATTNVGGMY